MIPKADPVIETDISMLLEKGSILKKKGLSDKDRETLFLVEQCPIEELYSGKYVCLLFSAQWCAPCQSFCALLKDFYADANIDGKQLDIIYCSVDRS